MGYHVGSTVSAIVDHKCPLIEEFEQALTHSRVTIARRGDLHRESIPIDSLHHVIWVFAFEHLGHKLGIGHVAILVAIVTQHKDRILPGASISISDIRLHLIYHFTSLRHGGHGKTSHTDVHLV